MSKSKKRQRQKGATKGTAIRKSSLLWIVGAVALVAVAVAGWFIVASPLRSPDQNLNALDFPTALPSSDTAFNVGTRVGQPAPTFTLPDAQGQAYAFKPGNDRKYVLAFNMGYV